MVKIPAKSKEFGEYYSGGHWDEDEVEESLDEGKFEWLKLLGNIKIRLLI